MGFDLGIVQILLDKLLCMPNCHVKMSVYYALHIQNARVSKGNCCYLISSNEYSNLSIICRADERLVSNPGSGHLLERTILGIIALVLNHAIAVLRFHTPSLIIANHLPENNIDLAGPPQNHTYSPSHRYDSSPAESEFRK